MNATPCDHAALWPPVRSDRDRVRVDDCFRELLAEPKVELRRPSPRIAITDLRAGAAKFMCAAIGPEVKSVTEAELVLADGRSMRVRRYGLTEVALPAIMFCHGGGFVFGDLDTHDAMCRALAVSSGAAVIALDYRCAPEHPFPAALEDAIAVVGSLRRDPHGIAVCADRLAFAGESAGGHIAIGAALAANMTGIPLAHLGLLYPVIDPRCNSGSMQSLSTGCLLSREAMQWYWDCYVPDAVTRADPRVDLLAANLGGLPPVTIVIAECDPLRDEDETFATRLAEAGVSVDVHRYAGMVHGFAGLPQITPVATTALQSLGKALGRALGTLDRRGC